MIDSSEKRNRQLAFELENSHVCEKRSKNGLITSLNILKVGAFFMFFGNEFHILGP